VSDRGPAVCVGGFGPLRTGGGRVAVAVGGVWHFAEWWDVDVRKGIGSVWQGRVDGWRWIVLSCCCGTGEFHVGMMVLTFTHLLGRLYVCYTGSSSTSITGDWWRHALDE